MNRYHIDFLSRLLFLLCALAVTQTSFADKTASSGSSRTNSSIHIEDIQIHSDTNTQSLTIRVHLANAAAAPQRVTLTGSFLAVSAGAKWTYPTITNVTAQLRPGGGNQVVTLGPLRWTPGKASWWWPNVPYQPNYHAQLHQLTVTVRNAEGAGTQTPQGAVTKTAQTQTVRFGFCTSGQIGSKYTLNGVRINLHGDDVTESLSGKPSGSNDSVRQPGFLPPTKSNAGWPGAVRNYQRLNFNVLCLKPSLCTQYGLDVCDDLGLLVIPEASRAKASLQPLRELILRNRNHPCVFKWSLVSELSNTAKTTGTRSGSPNSDLTESWLRKLYDTCMAADGSRPCSIDANISAPNWPRFAVIEHDTQALGTPGASGGRFRQDRPYGQVLTLGSDNISLRKIIQTALQARSLRAHDNADLRLSTLLAIWPEAIPGFSRTQKSSLDPKSSPSTPRSNAPALIDPRDPWQDPSLHLLQRSFAPVCAFDQNWDTANTQSNGSGIYPSVFPILKSGQSATRTVTVFNDEFADTALELTVRLLLHPTLEKTLPLTSIVHTLTVPPGGHIGFPVPVRVPGSADNTALEMQISVRKGGKERFRDRIFFLVQGTRGARLRFTGRDNKTRGHWQGMYGQQGFLLPMRGGVAQSTIPGIAIQRGTGFEAAATNDLHHDREEDPNTMFEWDRTPVSNDERLPPAGNGLTERHAIAFQGSQGMAFRIDATDGKPHQLALYLLDFARKGLALDIDAFDLQGHPLDTRRFDNYGGGSYVRYNFTGSVVLKLRSLTPNVFPLLTGIFVDAQKKF